MKLMAFLLLACMSSLTITIRAQPIRHEVTFRPEGISCYILYSIYNDAGKILAREYGDRQGTWKIRLPDGKYRYDTGGGIGYAPSSGSFVVSGKSQTVTVSYKHYFPVHFVAKNDADSVIAGMRIEISRNDRLVTYAYSLQKGKDIYLPEGTYTYTVSGDNRNPSTGIWKVAGAATLVTTSRPYRPACFCVRNGSGEATPGVEISYAPTDTPNTDAKVRTIQTDSAGLACTPAIPSGKYQVFTDMYPATIWRYGDSVIRKIRIDNRHPDTLLLGLTSDTIRIRDKRHKIRFEATNALGQPLPKAQISIWGGPADGKYPGYYRDHIDDVSTSETGKAVLSVVPGKYRYVALYSAGMYWGPYPFTRPAVDRENKYARTDGWFEITNKDIVITKQYNVYPLKIVVPSKERRSILIMGRGIDSFDYRERFTEELLINLPEGVYVYLLSESFAGEVLREGTFEINGKAEVLYIE